MNTYGHSDNHTAVIIPVVAIMHAAAITHAAIATAIIDTAVTC